jgi:cell division protein ZipA
MELSVKDWMIIVGVLLLAAVLFDGLRRVINDRRNNIRMRAKPVYHEDRVDLDLTSHEIPGNARIVLRADGTPMPLSEQKVPVLLEPAEDLKGKKTRRKKKEKTEHVEPVFNDEPFTLDAFADEAVAPPAAKQPAKEQAKKPSPYQPVDEDQYDNEEYDDEDQDADAALNEVLSQQSAAYSAPAPSVSSPAAAKPSPYAHIVEPAPERTSAKSAPSNSTQTKSAQEQDVVVMHVLARDNAGFKGADLMQLLLGCGMRYGKMNIFHRYEEGSTEEIQFSVANLVEPGTFDLDALHHFTTPGISFFMTLPGPEKPLQAFDYMAATAQEIARHLDGEIYDERKRHVDDGLIADRRLSIQHYADHAATV